MKKLILLVILSFFLFYTSVVYAENYANNEIIVKFKSGYIPTKNVLLEYYVDTGIPSISNLNSKYRINSVKKLLENTNAYGKKYGLDRLYVLKSSYGFDVNNAVTAYSKDSNVEYVEPNYLINISLIPNDPSFSNQWGLHNTGQNGGTPGSDIHAPEAWDVSKGSNSVIVAVIDTGISYNHPDLAANMWTNPGEIPGNGQDDDGNGYPDDFYGWNFITGKNNSMDDNGHGTHCAGIIGAVGNNSIGVTGVNWNVKLMALKFLDSTGKGSTTNAINAINYAILMSAHVLSASWGSTGYSQFLKDAIQASNNANQIFVAAAGNGGSDGIGDNNDVTPFYPASYDLPNIIAVAATDNKDNLASFSNYGKTSVDLGAPGVYILSTYLNGQYAYADGTSMAAPFVSGVAALIKSFKPEMSNLEIKNGTLASVDQISSLQSKTVTNGRLNASKALESMRCLGNIELTLSPSTVDAYTTVIASTSGLSNCNGKYVSILKYLATPTCGCTVSDPGCSCTFTSPSTTGTYTYIAYIDKNGDGDYTDTGESYSTQLIVSKSGGGCGKGCLMKATEPYLSNLEPAIKISFVVLTIIEIVVIVFIIRKLSKQTKKKKKK